MATPPPTTLTVNRLVEPIHIWTGTPRFGWQLPAGPSAHQTAYELEVRRAADGQVIGSTGKVPSSASHSVTIPDTVLPAQTRFTWRVRVWTEALAPSAWAQASFETTLLDSSEWTAKWVEPEQLPVTDEPLLEIEGPRGGEADIAPVEERLHPSPLLRQCFTIDQIPERARLYITARGVYEVTINGEQVTDEVLAPGYDEYQKRLSYQTYDATAQLREGANVIGIRLADGWWSGRISFTGTSGNYGQLLGVLWQLESDGETLAVSDDSARSSFAETRYSDIYIGEKSDARLAQPGWDSPGFDDTTWSRARISSEHDLSTLVPFIGEPVRRVLEIPNPRILATPKGELIVDLGQNIAGRLRLKATGHSGTKITLEHTESLDRHGNFQQNIIGRNKDQTDVWILSGQGEETYEPRFTFHGFRYVRVTGYPGTLRPEDVTGIVLSTDLPQTGAFTTDNARINRLHENVVWSQRGNFLSLPTDCPQRERAGWTGDVQVFSRAATNNARVDLFFERWLGNVRAAQSADGIVPVIVPNTPSFADAMGAFIGDTSAGWGDVITILPLALYERYGDVQVLKDNYQAMKAWVAWIRNQAEQVTAEQYLDLAADDPARLRQTFLWNTGFHFGDWLVPSTVTDDQNSLMVASGLTGALVASAFYYHSVDNLARAATILGDDETAGEMAALSRQIREAFMREYVRKDGQLTVHMQGAYVLVLAFHLVPENLRGHAGQHLVHLVHQAGDRLDTGFLSTPYLLDVLTSLGERELAYKLLLQDSVPSWLYEVDRGATTIWESWSGVEPDGQPRELSLNHYAFGAVDDWMFRNIAGIRAGEAGYSSIEFAPDLTAPFETVEATVGTPFGDTSIHWSRDGNSAQITVLVPGNTTGTLQLAGQDPIDLPPGHHSIRVTLPREHPALTQTQDLAETGIRSK